MGKWLASVLVRGLSHTVVHSLDCLLSFMAAMPAQPLAEAVTGLGLPQLELALHTVDPRVVLVPPRILRRIIKQAADISGLGLRVPHRKSFVIARDELLDIVDLSELDLTSGITLAETVLLLARPTPQHIITTTPAGLLRKYWRLLFHLRVHLTFEQSVAEGRFSLAAARQRIAELGEAEYAEIRLVLRQEDMLLPPRTDLSIYIEFVAVYLELRHFAEHLLGNYFPELRELGRVDDIVSRDLDVLGLLAATRPVEAPDHPVAEDSESQWAGGIIEATGTVLRDSDSNTQLASSKSADSRAASPSPPSTRSEATLYARLMEKARLATKKGNIVRATILHVRAMRIATADDLPRARRAVQADLDQLAQRLQRACGFTVAEIDEWSKALAPLVEDAARGIWSPEVRLLYDLQKACVDHERGIYALNLWGWIKSFGAQPLKRLLPGQRDVLMVKHLRGAQTRLTSARITERARKRLDVLLESVLLRTESVLRQRFRPLIEATFDRVRLLPRNLPEQVGRQKVIDELLDRIVERGFLSMGDLRDALSRNSLKLPDVNMEEFDQWLSGDQLLAADQQLAARLDGVYRRGEIYLRLPQRLSSLAFGTPVGRFLTRYVAIPFGGAYVALEFAYHLAQLVTDLFGHETSASQSLPEAARHYDWTWWLSVVSLGLLIEGLLHYQAFRQACLELVWLFGRIFRRLFIEWPALLLALPWVQYVLKSRFFRLFQRYAFKPAIVSALITAVAVLLSDHQMTLKSALGTFVVTNLVLNSRFGRNVDELITDWVVQKWHQLRIRVFAALYRFIVDLFQRILETIERMLYGVDEWLRFKAGERRLTTVVKATLTPIWRLVDYVIRLFVNLLIEPQINPIKHFPVVTVSHKIIWPFLKPVIALLKGPLGEFWATAIATPAMFLIPGVFGFLVWELKENWRLYSANRPANLQPSVIGHHGEAVIHLLYPGFRSGTLPKIFARLRRADRRAYWTGRWKSSARQIAALHHVEEELRRFVTRDFLEILVSSGAWHAGPVSAGEILLGTNRILIELYAPERGEHSLWLALEEHAGWLVANVHARGWLDRLSPRERRVLTNALAGFYKLAGVHLVREQLDAAISRPMLQYDIDQRGLVIQQCHPPGEERVYTLSDWPRQVASESQQLTHSRLPSRKAVIFAARPISWDDWVQAWEQDQAERGGASHLLADPHLLPLADDSALRANP